MDGIKNLTMIDGEHLRGRSVTSIDLTTLTEPSSVLVVDPEERMSEPLLEDASSVFVAKQLLMETVLTAVLPVAATTAAAAEVLVNAIPEEFLETVIHNCENKAPLPFVPSPTAVQDVKVMTPHEVTQPLGDILTKHVVHVPAGGAMSEDEINRSIEELDKLIGILQQLDPSDASSGRAPGFETRVNGNNYFWTDTCKTKSPYQVLTSLNSTKETIVPQPTPAMAFRYFLNIKKAWEERRNYLREARFGEAAGLQFCSCIREWGHATGDVMVQIANQSLEQAMVRESSACVTARMMQPGFKKGEVWDKLYEPHTCSVPDENMYVPGTPLRLVMGRDDYVASFSWFAMNANSTVDVCTCYLFPHDPAQRYILLDLLPCVALRGVKVRLCIDLMTVESAIVKSAFLAVKQQGGKKHKARGGYEPLSFLSALPNGCPTMSENARAHPASPLAFIQKVLDTAAAIPDDNFQVRWWCARDAQDGYRVKNHAKCATFDAKKECGVALIGGSNVVPTLESGDSDCDLAVSGPVAKKIGETFDYLWSSLDTTCASHHCNAPIHEHFAVAPTSEGNSQGRLSLMSHQKWLDDKATVALVRSEPCSSGEDAVLRHVLGAIATANKSVLMCMGHCNFPMSVARALGEVTRRGVTVKLLVNSLYSSDLRVNQRDMFLSLKDLLSVAPDVEVWATALPSKRRQQMPMPDHDGNDRDNHAPPFLHSKYTVVDSKWVAVGSWNVWARSAFHEIEHELLVQSETVAAALEAKFEKERNATTVRVFRAEECVPGAGWCPAGCQLCLPYGPFYVDV